jgi:O-methyltransferase involved in polyketide biosynthesis
MQPLVAEGFSPDQPTAWLAEGLLVYLDDAQATHVVTTLTAASAPDSGFATERTSDSAGRLSSADTRAVTELWRGGLAEHLQPHLTGLGWTTTTHPLGEVANRYGRPMSRQTTSGFVTARRFSADS